MKLKRLPEDFQVDELSQVTPTTGPFALYRLTKQSIGTPEAINAVIDRWKIPRRRISYGGLKDRHALTSQFVTVHHGPKKPLSQKSFEMEYLGQVNQPFTAEEIDGNRFTIVLRDLTAADVEQAQSAAEAVRRDGLPNYFDDQRFGSLGFSGEWIGRSWCLGDWERTLWLALADPHPDDRSDEKKQKTILRELWGRWTECKQALDRSHRRSIVTFLADKESSGKLIDFRGAFCNINVDLRGLYLSAFQSALWNRMLHRRLQENAEPGSVIPFELKSGPACFVTSLSTLSEAVPLEDELPLPSARGKFEEGPTLDLINSVVAEAGLEKRQLRVKYPRDSFFSKSSRKTIIEVPELEFDASDDELYPNRQKVLLAFDLPRGSYATILVKRLTIARE
ncbi:MAG: tRNA pseudouridine(13) synthase TruD [Planctomycetota bacterium]|nr:tRNA pseudouridine(13) synthase TruD [Planctomycetota bacterium]